MDDGAEASLCIRRSSASAFCVCVGGRRRRFAAGCGWTRITGLPHAGALPGTAPTDLPLARAATRGEHLVVQQEVGLHARCHQPVEQPQDLEQGGGGGRTCATIVEGVTGQNNKPQLRLLTSGQRLASSKHPMATVKNLRSGATPRASIDTTKPNAGSQSLAAASVCNATA